MFAMCMDQGCRKSVDIFELVLANLSLVQIFLF